MATTKTIAELTQEIDDCDSQFDTLFQDIEHNNCTSQLERKLIKDFNRQEFQKALMKGTDDGHLCLQRYQKLVAAFAAVKTGQMTAQDAQDYINKLSDSRAMHAIFHNVLKLCDMAFWVLTAMACYVTGFGIGIPLLILKPILGIFLIIGTAMVAYQSASNFANCIYEFDSVFTVEEEQEREEDVLSKLSLFATQKTQDSGTRPAAHEVNDLTVMANT